MTREEIIQAISDDKMMPFIQPEQLAQIVEFVIKNYQPSLPSNLDEAAERYGTEKHPMSTIGANESAYDFKAGAGWMAEQGVTETSRLYRDPNPPHEGLFFGVLPFFSTVQMALNYQDGEEVIVQIRKK